jgi:hypothetical protein
MAMVFVSGALFIRDLQANFSAGKPIPALLMSEPESKKSLEVGDRSVDIRA